jgi:hypothetical protein
MTRRPFYRIGEAHGCEHLRYASDPSNKESAARLPQPRVVSTAGKPGNAGASSCSISSPAPRKGPGCKHSSPLEDRKQADRCLTSKPGPIRPRSKPTCPAIQAGRPHARPHPGEALHAEISGSDRPFRFDPFEWTGKRRIPFARAFHHGRTKLQAQLCERHTTRQESAYGVSFGVKIQSPKR